MRSLTDFVLALIEPTGFAWTCLFLLTLAFAWRRRWRAALATAVPTIILFVFGSTDAPGFFMRELERPYADVDLAALPKADAIVLLGGGVQPARFEVADMHLTASGDRVIMAIELSRLGKAPVLVLGGSVAKFPDRDIQESETVKAWLVDRKLVQGEVIALPGCADTHDEALFTKQLVQERGWQQVLLVTSACHMRRAVGTFRTAGVSVIPAPCNFMTELSHAPSPPGPPGPPRAGGLEKMAVWLHEVIGWLEYRRRGWIDPAKL
jgi:uncharacterized SAM-binding protein YcdF (DUF218 family)